MATILVVDDEASVRFTLKEVLEEEAYTVIEADGGKSAIEVLARRSVDLVVSDLSMPEIDGMQLLSHIAQLNPSPLFIMVTAHGSERQAVKAMKLGAFDYIKKPFDIDELVLSVRRALNTLRLSTENRQLRARLALGRTMIFDSQAMYRVAETVERVAARDVTILISGESGTGKELVADALVAASGRKQKPLIKFSCVAVPENLLESALFGHERGAFTGADRSRSGCFRDADGGTLFLDEIGELPMFAQTKLLRALQSGEIQPVGGRVEQVDVRIIAATNRDLLHEIGEKNFREDLYYRLNVVQIHLPPLRDRREDIPRLIDHFFAKYAERFNTGPLRVPETIREQLSTRDWPGNVRELEHAIERLTALSRDGVVEDLNDQLGGNARERLSLKEQIDAFERGLVARAIRAAGGNQSEAARKLQISRVTLIDKLKKYGLK